MCHITEDVVLDIVTLNYRLIYDIYMKKLFFCHLLTLMSFQTCMSFFLMLNTEEDILKNFEEPNSCWSPLYGSLFLPLNQIFKKGYCDFLSHNSDFFSQNCEI